MVAKRLQYRYDAVGNKVGMTDADGGLFTYTYDVMRRLTGVINPVGERTTYTYDLNGRRTSVQLANGTRTSYSYDQGSRVQQIHTLKSNNSTVAKFDYAYDNNGRRTSVLEADGSRVTWTYDGTSQVTSEWRTGTSPFRHTFVYDTRGNRTLKIEDGARTTLVYDAANQLSSSEDAGGTTNYTYDANGNQHVTVAPGGSRTTQIWDYENRLAKTLQPGGGVSTMAYDADGLRVRKETPSETKLFVWDDQNYLAETDDTGVTEVAYTTEPSTYGSTISHRSGGATTTYHFDALAAARVLTNASETVLESYNYTAFGTILGTPTLGTPTLLTPFLWGGLVGYYWDAELATQYIRARHYQPHIARWISLDPIGFAGGDTNLFRYVGNSPTPDAIGRQVALSASAYGHLVVTDVRSIIKHQYFASLHRTANSIPPRHFRWKLNAGDLVFSTLDPSGLACATSCCCCPVSLDPPKKAENKQSANALEGTIFSFDVMTKIELKPFEAGNGLGCRIEWQECSDRNGSLGQKAGEWFKVDTTKAGRFGNWDDYEAGKLKLACPGGNASLKWTDFPNVNTHMDTKIIKFAVRVYGEPGCNCKDLEPVFFTFQVIDYNAFDVPKHSWSNMGKEIVLGIDDNAEPTKCKKIDIKWSGSGK